MTTLQLLFPRLAFALTLSPLSVIAAWGLLLVLPGSVGRKSFFAESPQPHALRANPLRSAAFFKQSTTGEFSPFWSDLCLQPINESTTQGAAIVQQPCNSRPAQQWTAVQVGNNTFHYKNQLSGFCLDARGPAANRTPVQQWTCNKISNENWEPGPDMDDEIPPLYSRVSGTNSYCLDVPGGQQTHGLAIQIYRCNGTLSQDWYVPY